ncbi:MAG TPA: hydantoinase/oxoprolinase N-terminal domain-containing protein [Methylomirabilota bacterium]|nr:hydantoinase/oxoprolinase N-terminal domain-containing protein [Methylomirabilota bacterium]
MSTRAVYSIDIDIGGTFTDAYVTGNGRTVVVKTDTTPHDLAVGVLDAIDRASALLNLSRHELLRRPEVAHLSTTVGTNTFIKRAGPKIGLRDGGRGSHRCPRHRAEPGDHRDLSQGVRAVRHRWSGWDACRGDRAQKREGCAGPIREFQIRFQLDWDRPRNIP